MARVLVVTIFLASTSSVAFNTHSWWPSAGTQRLLSTILITSIIINEVTASNQESNNTDSVLTDSFIIGSVWAGNIYGILDILGWILDWVAALKYYAKKDTKDVISLREKRKELHKQLQDLDLDKLKLASNACDKIINYIKLSDNNDTQKNIENIVNMLDITIDCLNQEIIENTGVINEIQAT